VGYFPEKPGSSFLRRGGKKILVLGFKGRRRNLYQAEKKLFMTLAEEKTYWDITHFRGKKQPASAKRTSSYTRGCQGRERTVERALGGKKEGNPALRTEGQNDDLSPVPGKESNLWKSSKSSS